MKIHNSHLFAFFYMFEKGQSTNYLSSDCIYLHLKPEHTRNEADAYFDALGIIPDKGLENQKFYRFSNKKNMEPLIAHARKKNWFQEKSNDNNPDQLLPLLKPPKKIETQSLDEADLLEHKTAMLEAVSKGNIVLVQILLGEIDERMLGDIQKTMCQIKQQQIAREIEYTMYDYLSKRAKDKTQIQKVIKECLSDARETIFHQYVQTFFKNKEEVLCAIDPRKLQLDMDIPVFEYEFRKLLDYCTFYLFYGFGWKSRKEPSLVMMHTRYLGIGGDSLVSKWPTENFSNFIQKRKQECLDIYHDFLKAIEITKNELKKYEADFSAFFKMMIEKILHQSDYLPESYRSYLNHTENLYNLLSHIQSLPIDFVVDGKSPLFCAMESHNLAMIKFLLNRGATIDFPVSNECSAWELLHWKRSTLEEIQKDPSNPVTVDLDHVLKEMRALLGIYHQELQIFKELLQNPITEFFIKLFQKDDIIGERTSSLNTYMHVLTNAEFSKDGRMFVDNFFAEAKKTENSDGLFLGRELHHQLYEKVSNYKENIEAYISKTSYGSVFSKDQDHKTEQGSFLEHTI